MAMQALKNDRPVKPAMALARLARKVAQENSSRQVAAASPIAPGHSGDALHSWKEIAVYLHREVRTVQRWEKHEGLPVRRHTHRNGASIFAFIHEVDAWQRSRTERMASPKVHAIVSLRELASRYANQGRNEISNELIEALLAQLMALAAAVVSANKSPAIRTASASTKISRDSGNSPDDRGASAAAYTFLSRLQ